jgi:hypothetical protein
MYVYVCLCVCVCVCIDIMMILIILMDMCTYVYMCSSTVPYMFGRNVYAHLDIDKYVYVWICTYVCLT